MTKNGKQSLAALARCIELQRGVRGPVGHSVAWQTRCFMVKRVWAQTRTAASERQGMNGRDRAAEAKSVRASKVDVRRGVERQLG